MMPTSHNDYQFSSQVMGANSNQEAKLQYLLSPQKILSLLFKHFLFLKGKMTMLKGMPSRFMVLLAEYYSKIWKT